MGNREQLLAGVARDQRGVFTIEQAAACGIPRRTITSRATRGFYETIHPGVYGLAGSESTWHRRVVGAILSTVQPAAASHRTAAYLWGMTSRLPESIEVVTRRHRRLARRSFTVHESKDLLVSDIVNVDRVDVTSAVRTIVDLGASAPRWRVESCLDTALRKELFQAIEVRRFIARVARPGRIGIGKIRPLIEERLDWVGLTESRLEDEFRALVAKSSLPMPGPQYEVHAPNGDFICRSDFAYPARRALIELDSEAYHMDGASFQADRAKQNEAHSLGWTVYRFTWRQIFNESATVLRTLALIWAE